LFKAIAFLYLIDWIDLPQGYRLPTSSHSGDPMQTFKRSLSTTFESWLELLACQAGRY
jgi:hypothetical protein